MKSTKVLFILLFLSLSFYGQNSMYKVRKGHYDVISTTGLNLRDNPNSNSKILKKLPFATKVEVTESKSFGIDSIGFDTVYYEDKKIKNPIIGNWVKVKYRNSKGFLFSPYLGIVATMDKRNLDDSELNLNKDFVLLFPGSGCFDNFWPIEKMNWFGVYQKREGFELKKVKLSYYCGWKDGTDPVLIDMEDFRISTNDNKNLLFIIGSKKKMDEGMIKGKFRSDFKASKKLKLIGSIEDPRLLLDIGGKQQVLNYNHDTSYYHPSSVVWEGDLDHDGKMDYIISYGDKSGRTYLYLSSEAENGKIVKPVSVFFDGYCC